MECFKKNNNDIKESLLKDIELAPFTVELSCDKEKYQKIYMKQKHPWQFFIETHNSANDIGWWKKNRYL